MMKALQILFFIVCLPLFAGAVDLSYYRVVNIPTDFVFGYIAMDKEFTQYKYIDSYLPEYPEFSDIDDLGRSIPWDITKTYYFYWYDSDYNGHLEYVNIKFLH